MLFSDTLFKGGSYAVHPSESVNQLLVPISQTKSTAEVIDVRVTIGVSVNAPYFVCHQIPFKLSPFALYSPLVTPSLKETYFTSEDHVKFSLKDVTIDMIEDWCRVTLGLDFRSNAVVKTE